MNDLSVDRDSDSAARLFSSGAGWQWHRDRLRRLLTQSAVGGVSEEEITAHFEGMPPRYWDRVTEDELTWGLQTVHRFLNRVVVTDAAEAAAVMDVRDFPQQGCSKILICTWDRAGLLTQVAGYLTALRLNVIRAQVYTRSDNIVLDVFWVCDSQQKHVNDSERLKQLAFLLEGGLAEPPRFASTWARQSHKLLPRQSRMQPLVTFNNTESPDRTIVTVEASERLGLLHDMLEALAASQVNITEALIDTIEETARDIFFITDDHKAKVTDPEKLRTIEQSIVKALA